MKKSVFIINLLSFVSASYAAHPLGTQDSGTVGKNILEVEIAIDYAKNQNTTEKEQSIDLNHQGTSINHIFVAILCLDALGACS